MPFEKTHIPGLIVFQPKLFTDSRGYFLESYNKRAFKDEGINCDFVQDNISKSSYGVLRGLHYQLNPYAQAKLVRVLSGQVLDVVVDIRKGSPTFGESFSVVLDSQKQNQLLIPRGFAHGFVVLTPEAEFFYKCDNYYAKESEGGIIYNDKDLSIDWKVDPADLILSEKDVKLPNFKNAINNFEYDA
ncbi:MAG: dTDP-4-dehydrorhamnose 3,5-epimerase [Chitinophagales bacterium]|nr:dTDP-4-dehydrorhamnose 3,5-epimerase [Chitinophagales bacterium]